jgi:putative phage-type endonuclease
MVEVNRRTYIGGTDIAPILGISKYKTPYEVYEQKLGLVEPIEQNEIMLWGKLLEPVILDQIEQRCSVKIGNRNDFFQHSQYAFLGNHPDGIDNECLNNEVKTVASWAYKSWTEPVPFEYYCQIQHEMDCIRTHIPEMNKTRFAVFEMDKRELHIDYIQYDPEFCDKQREFLIKFWNYNILQNIPPDYQVSDFARSNDIMNTYVETEADYISKIKQRKALSDQLKQIETQIETIDDEIKLKIGLNEGLRFGIDVLATWKQQSRNGVDSKLLQANYPDVYKQVLKESKFRVLRIKN